MLIVTTAQKTMRMKSLGVDKAITAAKERIAKYQVDLAAAKEKIAEKTAQNLLLTEEFEKNKKKEGKKKQCVTVMVLSCSSLTLTV